jgi:hypothetical protein
MTIYSREMKTTRRDVEVIKKKTEKNEMNERGAKNWEEEQGDGKRKSTDKLKNAQGKRLMEWIEENGWEVLNGSKQGDEEEE